MKLFDLRKEYGLSQQKAADICGVPLRTYIRYESDDNYGNALKRTAMINLINDVCEITEEKGILSVEQIIKGVRKVVAKEEYQNAIDLCYLFGSYAKGYASDRSDIDLCVSTSLTGLDYAGLAEDFRQELHKNIDLVRLNNAGNDLIFEIMKDGIKIYR